MDTVHRTWSAVALRLGCHLARSTEETSGCSELVVQASQWWFGDQALRLPDPEGQGQDRGSGRPDPIGVPCHGQATTRGNRWLG